MTTNIKVGLIGGRHLMETNDFIWEGPVPDPNDFVFLEDHAMDWIQENIPEGEDVSVDLYVTGLSQALSSFLVAWLHSDLLGWVPLTLWHWDRNQETYLPQPFP